MANRPESTLMFREAASAGSGISKQLQDNRQALIAIQSAIAQSRPPTIITCARGSSDHAATYLKYMLETHAGPPTSSFAPSIASVYGKWPHVENSICVAISQSGQSDDLLAVVKGMKDAGVRTVAFVNDAQLPLAELAQFVVPLHAGPERSVAATKSFIGSLFAGLQMAGCFDPDLISDRDMLALPALLDSAWALDWSPLVDCLEDAEGLYVIGRGIGLAVAGEAALKFKETCNLHAEAYSAAEVRHGPMALFKSAFPVLIFRQNDASASGTDEIAALAAAHGCRVFVVGGTSAGVTNLDVISAPAMLEPILQMQTFYKAVNALSLRRGCDPDCPPLLRKVTVTI